MTLVVPVPLLEVGSGVPIAPGEGWRVISADETDDVLSAIASGIGLILVHAGVDAADIITAIRTSGLAAAAVPIALLGGTQALDPSGGRPDLHISEIAADGIPVALAGWRPRALPEAYHRLEATFGADAVGGMAQRLCTVLAEALDALGTPAAADAAHKVAGVAGTLGFGELGQQWLALSHDPAAESPTLRRDTRTTIAAIVLHNAQPAAA